MRKTATILALAGLSMASNPEHIHGNFRNRKILDRKPLVDSSATLLADDEFQILRPDGGNSRPYVPHTNPFPSKPEKWTPPTNPKVWYPTKEDVRLYADDADDELQILRPDSGNSRPYVPHTNPFPSKPEKWTPPTNPKVWTKPKEDFRLYADDADDELQILRPDGPNYGTPYIPGITNRNPPKPEKWILPTNPKVWTPPREDVRLYADDADDELQILRPDGGNSRPYVPHTNPFPSKPEKWTPPTNPKVWYPTKEDVRLYADDADDELQILRPDSGNSRPYVPHTNPFPSKPEKWTPPTNPKVWTKPKEDFRLYADDADDELQILRPDSGNSRPYVPHTNPFPSKPEKWTPPTNPKVWTKPKEDFRLYADDADDELILLEELLNDN